MDIAQWENQFKPIKNHLNNNASLDGMMYETFGDELDFVKSHKNKFIWTYCDDGENGYLTSGYHLVNRLGYVICENPCDEDWAEVHLYGSEDF